MTTFDQLQSNPQVDSSIQDLLGQLADHSQKLTGIRPPNPELTEEYQATLDDFASLRGGKLFFPYLASGLGNGPLVELADGSVKYDYTCGIGVHLFGHSHPAIAKASLQAALEDVVMQGNIQQNLNSYKLTQKLTALSQKNGAPISHCFLSSSGVMAGENALKLALQKNSPASRVLAFERCFAGRTLAFSQINDKAAFRQGLPEILNVDYIPFYDEADPEGSTQRALDTLTQHLQRHPGQYAAMFFELIQGEGGYYPGTTAFHRALMECCREHQIAVLVDEVQTFARTHEPFAFQHYKLDDLVDIIWIGKAAQVCATLFTKNYAPKPGLIAQTYTASTSTVASALAILDELESAPYFGEDGKIAQLHNHFKAGLEDIAQRHPDLLSGPWGLGAMTGCTALDGKPETVMPFLHDLYKNGVMAFVAGQKPTRLRFLLPIGALTPEHITDSLKVLENTLIAHRVSS